MNETLDLVPALDVEAGALRTLTGVQNGLAAAVPGLRSRIGPYLDRPQLCRTRAGEVWLLSPLEVDPLLQGGRYVLPPSAVLDLKHLISQRIGVHALAVAHQLAPDGPVRSVIPLLREGPNPCTAEVARALVPAVPAPAGAARLAHGLGVVAETIVSSAVGFGQTVRTSAAALDPVIFGLVAPDGVLRAGRPVLWLACTSWEW